MKLKLVAFVFVAAMLTPAAWVYAYEFDIDVTEVLPLGESNTGDASTDYTPYCIDRIVFEWYNQEFGGIPVRTRTDDTINCDGGGSWESDTIPGEDVDSLGMWRAEANFFVHNTLNGCPDDFCKVGDATHYFHVVPPDGTGTMGYWKNHRVYGHLLPIDLGDYTVTSFSEAEGVFAAAKAKNAYNMLAGQLLAAKLNIASGVPSLCVVGNISDADTFLVNALPAGYDGPDSTTPPKGTLKGDVNAVKDWLDLFNNGGCPFPP